MKKLCLVLSALALGGCLHAAPKSEAPAPAKAEAAKQYAPLSAALLEKSVVKGKSTSKEITETFGPPNSVVPNGLLPPADVLAKATAPLPPIARTTEFWHYWTTPSQKELERAAATGQKPEVFRVMFFMDKDGVAVDYLTETRALQFDK